MIQHGREHTPHRIGAGRRRVALVAALLVALLLPRRGAAQAPPTETLSFPSVADAYVDAAAPTTNFNASALLLAGASPTRISYLRFAVTGTTGRPVLQARLRLGVATSSAQSGGTAHVITDTSWSESRVTYATRPAVDGLGLSTLGPVPTAGAVVEFVLDGAIRGDGVYNLAIDSVSAQSVGYSSAAATSGQKPTLVLTVAANVNPTVRIVQPPTGAGFFEGDRITFQGTATDSADGDLSAAIAWRSSVQGQLGTGATVATLLGLGNHTVTASVTDRDGFRGVDHVGITVSPRPPANTAPLVAITAPLDGASFVANQPITFAGTANDIEDGVLTPQLAWSSDRDGTLGAGGSFARTLSEGSHRITARVTDRDGLQGRTTATVTVASAGTLEFLPRADAYVDAAAPKANFGSNALLRAYSVSGRIPYLRFDVTGVGRQGVSQAILRLQVDSASAAASDSGGTVYAIPGAAWQEFSLNYSNAPLVDGPSLASVGPVASGQVVDFDVTAGISADGTYDLALVTTSLDGVDYRSRESKTPPKLILSITGNPPIVTITSPPPGAVFITGTPITLTGTATDAEDGDLTSTIRWTSSLDGTLGTGARIGPRALRTGLHTLTAAVTDADGRPGQAQTTIRVRGPNAPPRVTITAPANGSSAPAGTPLTLGATAVDDFDGDLSARIQWTSSRDGLLGLGGTRSVRLSEGTHTLTASVIDSDGALGSMQITRTVTPSAPVVTITTPRTGAPLFAGTRSTLSGSAIDATDGDLSDRLAWTSNVDGPLGTGASITVTKLRLGTHTLTATAQDAGGLVGTAQMTVLVRPPNVPPVITMLAPADGSRFLAGKPTLLAATATDAENGDLSALVRWTSSRDGTLGTGALLTVTKLSPGAQVLTASVTDRDGTTSTTSVAVTVLPATLTFDAVADTYVDAALPTRAFGTATGLFASSTPLRQAFFRFAVQGLESFTVQQGVLRLTVGTGSSDGSTSGGTVSAIGNDAWPEATTTYATRPTVDGPALATRAKVSTKQVVDFDVTAALHGEGSYDFALTSTAIDPVRYQSRETSNRPRLVVTLTQNTPPLVFITAPASGSKIGAATAVTFTGRALDAESGNVSSQIQWSSSVDGPLGTGATITVPTLSAGAHTITAAVTQSDGSTGQAQITLRVRGPNLPPTVTITAPADHFSVPAGTVVTLSATTADEWDDDLSGRIQWTSGRDGALGGGTTRTVLLSEGTHTITATVTDLDGAQGSAQITVTVTPTPPVVTITGPPLGTVVLTGSSMTFSGMADDATDGDLSAALDWTSDRDGALGSGPVITAVLSTGTHVVTASATDAGGLVGSARRTVVVNAPPVVVIVAPAAGLTLLEAKPVRLVATATDAEDGDLSRGIHWTSDRDGDLGAGPTITPPGLSAGTHTLTASVADRYGAATATSITVTVVPSVLHFAPVADTYVDANQPTARFGTTTDLFAGSGPVRQAFLRFAVSDVAPFIVERAVLRLTVGPGSNDGGKVGTSVYTLADRTWSEATTTYATRPAVPGVPLATGGTVAPKQVVEFDVTPAVTADGTCDLALASPSTDWIRYLSRESNTGKPELVVTLRQNGPQVTIFQPASGAVFLTTTPVPFLATAVDPEDGDVSAGLTWTSDRDGVIGQGARLSLTSLSPGTHVVTAAAANRASLAGLAQVSFTVQVAGLAFTPIADTYVDQLLPTTIFGSALSLGAGGAPSIRDALLRFAVTGIGARPVADARLQLTVHDTNTASGGEGGTVHRITDNRWSETATTFNNVPSVNGPVLDAIAFPVGQRQLVEFHLGAVVTQDGTFNFALTSGSTDTVKYDSREAAHPPRLVVLFLQPPSTLPEVTITAPAATSSSVFNDQPVTLTATATDARDGLLTRSLAWRSSLDGALGTGGTVTVARLSRGTHVITASVRNRAGATGTAGVTVTVADRPPAVTITAPGAGTVFPIGAPVVFTATATDDQDGNLGARLVWASDRDGPFGSGPSVTIATLSPGDHHITASVTNSLGTSGSAAIDTAIGNAGPRLTVTAPAAGTTVAEGTAVTLRGSASDLEDGDLTPAIVWTSSRQGPLGTGGTVPATLSATGLHRITASITDSGGATRTRELAVTVTLAPPMLTILSPSDGSSFSSGVTLVGRAVDYRDGDRSQAIRWRSDVAGTLGRGASVSVPSLAFGRHLITAQVTDSDGLIATQSITLVVGNTPPAVTISSPASGTTANAWAPIRFDGWASDPSDGDLSAGLRWFSNLSGSIGSGPSFSTSILPRGTHLITALAADSHGLTGSAQVVVTVKTGPPSQPPQVTIAAPASGTEVVFGAPITFTATVVDETSNLSAKLAWLSDRDGVIGTGASFTTRALSLGSHHVTAVVQDPGGTLGSAALDVSVVWPDLTFPAVADASTDELAPDVNAGSAPTLQLDNQPVRRIYLRFVVSGLSTGPVRRAILRLQTTAPITAGSDMGGELRTVSQPWEELTVTHLNKPPMDSLVRASVGAVAPAQTVDFDVTGLVIADGTYNLGLRTPSSNGVEYVAREAGAAGPRLVVFRDPPATLRPSVHITAPADPATATSGKPVTFTATATDPQDGDLGATLAWRSDRDGALGTGPTITKALSAGVHVITAMAIDRDGNTASDLVHVLAVVAAGPVITIAAPVSGAITPFGTPVSFRGSAFDSQDGDLSFALRWTSNQDGLLGTGPAFTRALSPGTHTITATVTDATRKTGSATARIQVSSTRVGYEDFGFGPNIEVSLDKATSTKPQSKLWVQDGIWWACLFVPTVGEVHIHRLDLPTQTWIDTGVLVDSRGKSRQDVLVDGQTLYMASRFGFTGSPPQNLLLRYTYQSDAQTYALDPGFPVNIPGGGAEALTIAKDSRGILWIAYALNGQVFAAHSLGDDAAWGAPFQPPVAEGTTATIDDDAAVIALPGGKIGVFWSNQVKQKFYFAVHTDGAPDLDRLAWRLETAAASANVADDHFNLKLASDGRLFVAVKTSINTPGQVTVGLLVRSRAGVWAPLYKVTNYEDGPTRPICLLDEVNRRVYVFYSSFMSDIYYKASDMDAIAFQTPGVGLPLMVSGTNPSGTSGINDPTSTKQSVDPSTGILVLASSSETDRYWHGWVYLPQPRPTVTITTPAAGTTVRTGTPVGFAATALSAVDGDIATRLAWTSSRNGTIGTGSSFTTTALSSGVHTITATATDGTKLTGSATITLIVDPDAP